MGLATFLASMAAQDIRLATDFEKQLPRSHPYIKTVLDYRSKIPGLNAIQITVETQHGDIWTPAFLKTLYNVTQDVTFLPGIQRTSITSMWTPNSRVIENKEGEIAGRDLVPSTLTADRLTPADAARIRDDALKGGFRGWLFSRDMKAAMIQASVLDFDPQTNKPVDYFAVAAQLESIRAKYEKDGIVIRIIGFTKFIGDVTAGAVGALKYFVLAFILTALAAWLFARSFLLAALAVGCSLVSVVWQLAILALLGIGLNPLGLIIPFLVFAIGVSHGVQQVNLIATGVARCMEPEAAARAGFRRLFLPGAFALLTALISFLALFIIDIPVVHELAMVAIVGIALKFVSNLIMLPLLASSLRFKEDEIVRLAELIQARDSQLLRFAAFAHPRAALITATACALLLGVAVWQGSGRAIGDLKLGAPELSASSRYNQDLLAIADNFNVDLDAFVVVAETPPDACVDYRVMSLLDQFAVQLRATEGVKSVISLAEVSRTIYAVVQEGSLKWRVLPRDPTTLSLTTQFVPQETGLLNKDCSLLPVVAYLTDHRAPTIRNAVAAAERFIAENQLPDVKFRLATGNVAVYAAMNDTVAAAEWPTLALVFVAIIALVWIAFGDWRAAIVCAVPLLVANFLGLWLMRGLGIGLKVSTLPVFVIAVGIGVDYAFYVYARLMLHFRTGAPISVAYVQAMQETGVAVVFTGITLAAGVSTWAFSTLEFQSDMGLLLAFMFLINMIATVTLLPSLAVLLEAAVPRRHRGTAPIR